MSRAQQTHTRTRTDKYFTQNGSDFVRLVLSDAPTQALFKQVLQYNSTWFFRF